MWSFVTGSFYLASSIQVVACIITSFLLLNKIPWYNYATFYLSILELLHTSYFHFMTIRNDAAYEHTLFQSNCNKPIF